MSVGAVLVTGCSEPGGVAGEQSRGSAVAPEGIRTFRSVHEPPRVPAPRRLRIPAIGVSSRLERLGRHRDRTVEVPRRWHRAGWYEEGPRPGEPGSAVLLGHVDSPFGPAVFGGLEKLSPGARVLVDRSDGSTVAFRVTRIGQYPRARFPLREVYWPSVRRELRLITCGGSYDAAQGGYQDNVVVFAVATGNEP
ncbi:MAG TPA: class F sortase [Actinomycetes bacterium]